MNVLKRILNSATN